jgi:hypothetical protein
MNFTFSNFFNGFAPYKGRPPAPLKVFSLLPGGNSSQHMYEHSIPNKTELRYLQTEFSKNFTT